MNLVNKLINILTVLAIGCVGFHFILLSGCASSTVSEQSVSAQTNQTNHLLLANHQK